MDDGFCVIQFVDGPQGPLSDYVHIVANAAYERNAGITDVVGKRLREIVSEEAADDWVEHYRKVLVTGDSIRFERELEETGRYLSLSSFRIDPPELRQVAVLFQDITARRKAEEDLRRLNRTLELRVERAVAERRLWADLIEGADAYVQVTDLEGRWLAINTAAADEFDRIFGQRPVIGEKLLDMLPTSEAGLRRLWIRALEGEEFTHEGSYGAPGHEVHYELRFSALKDEADERIGTSLFIYDVSDRFEEQQRLHQAEEALRQAQKMDAVGQLTGGLAHDFNNLLAGISGSLEMINARLAQGKTADIARYVTAAQGAARRAASLTHRLLAFARRQTLDPRPLVINSLLPDLVELVRRTVGPQINVESVAAAGLWPTNVDQNQLENALLNLCLNARDAMPGGGLLTIETANKWIDAQTAGLRNLEEGQYVTICVSDTGSGIDDAIIDKVFDPFFTTKPIGEGTGLGLSMVYGFALQSQGHVRIYSEKGQGTMVCMYLPRHMGEFEAHESSAAPAEESSQTNDHRVLVIDDEPLIRMLMVEYLEELGLTCAEASDGPSGLAILEKSDDIDLLVTDVGLPNGLNGRQVADRARELRPGIKVLFVTGYAENAALNHGHIGPGTRVLTKPFTVSDFNARIKGLVDQD